MSKFINYKKRSVTLPPGCKNLIDVLQTHGLPKLVSDIHAGTISPDERPTVTRGESFAGKLSDIEKYVAMVFESRARAFMLMITPPDEQITIDVVRYDGDPMEASVGVQAGTDQERAVHSFFTHHGLRVPEDSGLPSHFVPGLPVQVTCDILPLPPDVPLLSKLVADLFRDALALSDGSQLCFRYYEFSDAG